MWRGLEGCNKHDVRDLSSILAMGGCNKDALMMENLKLMDVEFLVIMEIIGVF
jgi:hypothetical protein